jgi:hypothetical protein
VKSEQEKTEKYSIKDIDPLIESIIKANPSLTEELICVNLDYNGGYISQLRSREKSSGEPQVSPKFYKQLQTFGLQNAHYVPKNLISGVAEPEVPYGVLEGKWGTGKDALINALLEEKDRAIKKAEEFAQKMENHYEDSKEEKRQLLDVINNTLKEISENLKTTAVSLKTNHEFLLAIGRTVRANDAEIMESLDHLEGNPAGTRQNRSHKVQKALREGVEVEAGDKNSDKDKIRKGAKKG